MGSTTAARATGEEGWLLAAGLLVATVTFVADLLVPLGVAAAVPHTLVVLIAFRSRRRRAILLAAGGVTILTVVGALLSPSGIAPEFGIVNRVLTLLVIWATALFLGRVRQSRTQFAETSRELADMTRAIDQAAIFAITDQRGIITYANDRFCEISGYSRQELLGQDHRIVSSGHHSREFIRDLWRTIARGEIWRGEIRNQAKDRSIYWVDTTIVPFLDARGKPYQYLAIRHDVTDRKKAEEKLRSQAALAQIGQMAAVVAHEVKNPLAGIAGAVQIIGGRLPEDSPDREVIGTILERIEALDDKVQELLRYAHPRPPHLAPMSILKLLEEVGEHLRNDPRFEQVDLRIDGQDLPLQGDAELLRDAFVNLILNSAQSMEGPGRIEVEVSAAGKRCRTVVRDEGPGIPEEVRRRIFEPFFSTRHSGTGLGLAIAKRVVEAHGGELEIDCPASGGTVATVEIPLD